MFLGGGAIMFLCNDFGALRNLVFQTYKGDSQRAIVGIIDIILGGFVCIGAASISFGTA